MNVRTAGTRYGFLSELSPERFGIVITSCLYSRPKNQVDRMDLKTSLLFDEIQKAGLVYFEARDVIPLAEKIGIRNGDINWRLGELAKQGKLRNLWHCRFRVYNKEAL